MERARSSLHQIKTEIKKAITGEQPDQNLIGHALLDVSSYLIKDYGNVENIEQLRKKWVERIVGSTSPTEEQDTEVFGFQSDLENILSLKEQFHSYLFYVPGSSGSVRLVVGLDGNNEPKVDLASPSSIKEIKERYNRISDV